MDQKFIILMGIFEYTCIIAESSNFNINGGHRGSLHIYRAFKLQYERRTWRIIYRALKLQYKRRTWRILFESFFNLIIISQERRVGGGLDKYCRKKNYLLYRAPNASTQQILSLIRRIQKKPFYANTHNVQSIPPTNAHESLLLIGNFLVHISVETI